MMKTKKACRALAFFLMAAMLFSAMSVMALPSGTGEASEPYCQSLAAASAEDSITWTLSEEGILTINGEGKMPNYFFSPENQAPWYSDRLSIKAVIISSGITSIGERSFADCEELTSVSIPNGVTSIGEEAFENCIKLTAINIPNGVTSIGYEAFENCIKLTAINIPNTVTSIDGHAFYYCQALTSIDIPNSVTSFGLGAFSGCISLTGITIPDGVTAIPESMLNNCSKLTSVVLPESLTTIGSKAFSECIELASIDIPKSVTTIGGAAFVRCRKLTSVVIPDGVTEIRNLTFVGCTALTDINIPDSVTSIGAEAFSGCTKLITIDLPNALTSIGESAFRGCSGLTGIDIPDGVKTIDGYAFEDCTALESIELPDKLSLINEGTFRKCVKLKSIVVPSLVKYIHSMAFKRCTALTSVNFQSGVLSSIYGYAFEGCTALESIELPDSLTFIASDALSNCTALTSITIPGKATTLVEGCLPQNSELTIYGIKGSTANEYADKNKIKFVVLTEEETTPSVVVPPYVYESESFQISVTTSGSVTKIVLRNENDKTINNKVVSKISNADGSISWTLLLSIGTASLDRVISIFDQNDIRLDSFMIDVLARMVFAPKSVAKNEKFNVIIYMSDDVTKLVFKNENGMSVSNKLIEKTPTEDGFGTIKYVAQISIGTIGAARTLTVLRADGSTFADFTLTVTPEPLEIISITTSKDIVKRNEVFEVMVTVTKGNTKFRFFNEYGKVISKKQISKATSSDGTYNIIVFSVSVGSAGAPRTFTVKADNGSGEYLCKEEFQLNRTKVMPVDLRLYHSNQISVNKVRF